jgi:hypothetical protein
LYGFGVNSTFNISLTLYGNMPFTSMPQCLNAVLRVSMFFSENSKDILAAPYENMYLVDF